MAATLTTQYAAATTTVGQAAAVAAATNHSTTEATTRQNAQITTVAGSIPLHHSSSQSMSVAVAWQRIHEQMVTSMSQTTLTAPDAVAACAPLPTVAAPAAPQRPAARTYTPPPAPVVRAPVRSRITDEEGIAIHRELMNIFNNPPQYTQRVSRSHSIPVPPGDTEGEICGDDDIDEINTEITNRWNRIHFALERGRQEALVATDCSSFSEAYSYASRNSSGDALNPQHAQNFLRYRGLEEQAAELKRVVENINRRLNP